MANPVRIVGTGEGGIQADVNVEEELKVKSSSALRTEQGFELLLVRDNESLEMMKSVLTQLKLISLKLNILQTGEEEFNEDDLEELEF